MKKAFLSIILFIFCSSIFATTFVVTNTNDSGPGSLRDAIALASGPITIGNHNKVIFDTSLLSNGNDTILLNSTIIINQPITIEGLMDNSDTLFISGQNLHTVFLINNPCDAARLDNLAIINGFTNSSGGAILITTQWSIIRDCFIANSMASISGGAIAFSFGGSCNNPDGVGGMYLYLENTTITNCSAQTGGAIYLPSLPFVDYLGNPSRQGMIIKHCNLLYNSAVNGGAIYTNSGLFTSYASPLGISYINISNSTLAYNSATGNGAGIYSYSENLNEIDVSTSTLAYNSATGFGGAIYNSSINTVDSIKFKNSTVVYNSSNGIGKAVYAADSTTQTIISGSIISDNGNFNEGFNFVNEATPIEYNLLDDFYSTFGTNLYLGNSINLGPLQDNGGNTLTMLPLASSVALNNGNPNDNTYAQNRPITDGMREIGAAEAGCFTFEQQYFNDTVCQGGSYVMPDGVVLQNILPNSGSYGPRYYKDLAVLSSSMGCDSIIEVTLSVNNPIYNQEVNYLCYGDSYTLPDGTFISSLNSNYSYKDTFKIAQSCDSIYTLLLVPSFNYSYQNDTVCFGGDYVLPNGSSIYNVNTNYVYKDTLQVSGRCDSIYTLAIIPIKNIFLEYISVCSGSDYTFQDGTVAYNVIYNLSHYDTFSLSNGCDSFYHVILYPITIQKYDYDYICPGSDYTLPDGTTIVNMTSTTIYRDTMTAANGCDSIYRLAIYPLYKRSIEQHSVCSGDDYIFPDSTIATNITNNITYRDTFPISTSCDSIHIINISVLLTDNIFYFDTICSGEDYTFPDDSIFYNITNPVTHQSIIQNMLGCDSIIETTLFILTQYNTTRSDTICPNGNYTCFDGTVYNNIESDFTHINNFSAINGCDSIIEERIFIRVLTANDFTSITESLCFNSSYTLQNGVILQNLINDTIFNITNCYDSITYSLIVEDDFVQTRNVVICPFDNYYMPDGTVYNSIDSSFTHINSLTSASGCDSTQTIHIVVDHDNFTTEYLGLCVGDSFTFVDGFSVQNIQEGLNHYNYFTSHTGCDSIFNTVISIPQINDSILLNIGFNFVQLIAVDNYADYQWYDCTSNILLIGDTNQIFQPTENGSYQVKLTKGNCEVYSECFPVSGLTPISNLAFEKLKLYPNPVSKQLILEAENLDFEYSILDITGKEISLNKEKTTGKIIFDTQKLSSGVYFLNVKNEASSKMFKFVKE